MDAKSNQCRGLKQDGERCGARPIAGGRYCFFHAPGLEERRQEVRRAGGITRTRRIAVLPVDTPDAPLKTIGDVSALMAETINHTRRGQLDPRVANALGYLAGILLKSLEQGEIEERLMRLEALMGTKNSQAGEFEFRPKERPSA